MLLRLLAAIFTNIPILNMVCQQEEQDFTSRSIGVMTTAALGSQVTGLPGAFSAREKANERMLRGSPSRQVVLLFLLLFRH